jgi:predicted membrane protein
VSAYTWTKGIAAGAYLVPLALALAGVVSWTAPLWLVATPVVAGIFLALTGLLLVADLTHPARFLLIFTRPQWHSWLVRGGFVLLGFGLVLAAHFVAGVTGFHEVARLLAIAGGPLALLAAVYTAYLFAQSKARDLWQNPLAPFHLLVQATLAGAGALALLPGLDPRARAVCLTVLAVSSAVHLLLIAAEWPLAHTTAHASLAHHEMTGGRYGAWFKWSVALIAAGALAPWLGPLVALPALAGLFAFEHAYVQAAQAVPLA